MFSTQVSAIEPGRGRFQSQAARAQRNLLQRFLARGVKHRARRR